MGAAPTARYAAAGGARSLYWKTREDRDYAAHGHDHRDAVTGTAEFAVQSRLPGLVCFGPPRNRFGDSVY